MTAIYNELDPFAAQWTRNLIAAGHVAPGVVDERSIAEFAATDVAGRGQRHFFAGIGVWSYALRLAGVPDDADIWTASCPCQPFSDAGLKRGFSDERHLWPALLKLIAECRPAVLVGEQVASRGGRAWFASVRADLEALGYAVGAADLCAASVGAPHIRQRLYFVAYADGLERGLPEGREGREGDGTRPADDRGAFTLADAEEERRGSRWLGGAHRRPPLEPERLGAPRGLEHPGGARGGRHPGADDRAQATGTGPGRGARGVGDEPVAPGPARGPWSDVDWLPCSDGKSRPVEPGTFPLAHGIAGRVGLLRAYGNALNSEQAASFVRAALGAIGEASSG